jgi:heterodisulfide reductase subunit C
VQEIAAFLGLRDDNGRHAAILETTENLGGSWYRDQVLSTCLTCAACTAVTQTDTA